MARITAIPATIDRYSASPLVQTEYQAKYNALADRFEKVKERLEAVVMEITEKQARREIGRKSKSMAKSKC